MIEEFIAHLHITQTETGKLKEFQLPVPESIMEIPEPDMRLLAVSGWVRFLSEGEENQLMGSRVVFWEHPFSGVVLDADTGDILEIVRDACPQWRP